MKSFRTSPWDPKENLPQDYARIFQFENFRKTKKRVLSEIQDGDGAMVCDFPDAKQWTQILLIDSDWLF